MTHLLYMMNTNIAEDLLMQETKASVVMIGLFLGHFWPKPHRKAEWGSVIPHNDLMFTAYQELPKQPKAWN